MADDTGDEGVGGAPTDDATDGASDGAADDTPSTRVARTRYVRSGWGVLFAVGVVAGVVIVLGGYAEFDTAPFCAEAERAASATTVTTAPPAPGAVAVPEQAVDLAAATARLEQYRAYEGTLPYDLTDELDLLIDREERLVVAIEALGPDATREQLDAAVQQVDGTDGPAIGEALFALDLYASGACGLGPDLVD